MHMDAAWSFEVQEINCTLLESAYVSGELDTVESVGTCSVQIDDLKVLKMYIPQAGAYSL
jgi:hypothetical protein